MQYDEDSTINRLPDFGVSESTLLAWRDRFYNKDSTYRSAHMERMTTGLHYTLGNQDITFTNQGISQTSSSYTFRKRSLDAGSDYPNPITNYVEVSVSTEMAALGKRKLVPKVVPSSQDPKVEYAANIATDILLDKLRKLGWDDKRIEATYYFATCGLITLKTYWDKLYSDTKMVGSPNAAHCPDCGTTFSSQFISSEQRRGLNIPEFGARQEEDGNHLLMACPNGACEGVLEPYEVGPDEVEQTDFFQRPLGMEVPKGEVGLDIVIPHELYLENGGIGVTPNTIKQIGQKTPRSMDYIMERWPQAADGSPTSNLEPESPDELMDGHPILGEWSIVGSYSASSGYNIYKDHLNVYEFVQDKCYRFPQGRYLACTKGKVLEDGPLYESVPKADGKGTVDVAKVKYHSARFKLRPGEFYGKGLPDDLISPQNVLNGIRAQMIDARERMGSPNILTPSSVNLQGPEWWEDYGAGKILVYEDNPLNPQSKPEVLEARSITSAAFQEYDQVKEDLKIIGAPKDVEIGEAPRNITTTTGLQLLSEQADRVRSDRETALVSMYESAWKHLLDLLWAFRLEQDEDTYETETPSGAWEEKQYDGTTIAGQTKVKIEKQAYVDKSVFIKEAAREAQLDGLYDASSPYSRIKLLEMRGLPTDVNENENLQVNQARRQWIDFKDEGIIPTIDETLDNPAIRFEVLGSFLLTNDGRDMAEAAGWGEIAKQITGWRYTFDAMLAEDQAARAYYGGVVPPEQAQQMFDEGLAQYEQALTQYQLDQQATVQMAQSDEQTKIPDQTLAVAPPPEPPPQPNFLPNAMEDKILAVWDQLLQQTGQPLPPPDYPETMAMGDPMEAQAAAAQKQQDFMRLRAVVEGYKVLEEQRQQAELMGQMQMEAPSSGGGEPSGGGPERPSPFSQPANPPQTKL